MSGSAKGRVFMYTFTDQFVSNETNLEFTKATMMGPNAMRMSEELASHLDIRKDMRILDLGCGMGLSTLFLARKYSAEDVEMMEAEGGKYFNLVQLIAKVL